MDGGSTGRDADLDRILDIFLSKKPIYPRPEELRAERSTAVEAQITAQIPLMEGELPTAQ